MKTAVSLGYFDGLHKGHRSVLDVNASYRRVAVTFKTSPKAELTGKNESLLTFKDRCEQLKSVGVDEVYALDFKEIRNMSPSEFFRFLIDKFNPSLINCGFNYRFGKNAEGNAEALKSFCKERGIELRVSAPVKRDEETVSSTYIKALIKGGDIQAANRLLLKPFSFENEVKNGDKRGRTIGFPTINQEYPKDLVIPKFGVYKTKVLFDNKEYIGITNIGKRPTYPSDYVISETNIQEFSGDLYGENVRICLLELLRGERKFNSLEELKNHIAEDKRCI